MAVRQRNGKGLGSGSPLPQRGRGVGGEGRLGDPARRLWDYVRVHLKQIVAGCFCGVVVSLIMLSFAWMIQEMLKAMESGDKRLITFMAASAVAVYFIKGIFHFGQVFLLANVAERMAQRLRNDVYQHLQGLSLGFFESRKTGSLMATISSDIPVIQQNLMTGLMEGVAGPVTAIGGIVYLVWLNPRLAVATLICLPLMGAVIHKAGRRMRRASESIQQSLNDTSALATEALAAVRVVHSFGREEHEISRFCEQSHRTYRANMRVVRLNGALKPMVELIGAFSIAFILWLGGMEIAEGRLAVKDVISFLYVADRITASIQEIGRLSMYLNRIRGAAKNVFAVLDIEPQIRDLPGAGELDQVDGRIAFEDVHFGYDGGSPVLRGLSFEVKPGEAVALVGPSGVGKSTIASLIPRFYDVTSGRVRVDGKDLRAVTIRSLRSHIGIVAQEPVLFSGSIRENIAYGRPDATEAEVVAAARAANAHDFITRTLPEGYETLVGERGVKLSGGQRQRIAIARAILKDPRILILDEATSALDAESEALVQEALEKLMQGRTTIIIAHRLSTVRNADRILVLADGGVREQGTHAELLRSNGLYARLYETGFGADAARGDKVRG